MSLLLARILPFRCLWVIFLRNTAVRWLHSSRAAGGISALCSNDEWVPRERHRPARAWGHETSVKRDLRAKVTA